MKKLSFSIYDYATISMYTDMENVANEFIANKDKIMKTIPLTDFAATEEIMPLSYNNSIYIKKGLDNIIDFDVENNSVVATVKNNKIRVLDFIYVMLEMFANNLCNKKKFLLHSSALQYDSDKSILLVGDANSGKSTLAYYLMSKYGMKLISNDHTVIGQDKSYLTTFSGTKPLELRYGVISKYFPEFSYLIRNCTDLDLWSKKVIVNDYIDKKMISSNDTTIVSDIFQVDLCENGSCFLKTKDYIDQRLFLYEHLSKQLKGTYNLITGYDYPMPSCETREKLKTLDDEIKQYLETTEVHMCKGSINSISKEMVRKLEKK